MSENNEKNLDKTEDKKKDSSKEKKAVSYTHLTLPTSG